MGKKIIEEGLSIVYEPDAEVFHHHGLHQGNNLNRAKGVVSVIEKIETESINDLPESMLPENAEIIALIPVSNVLNENSFQKKLFEKTLQCLEKSKFSTLGPFPNASKTSPIPKPLRPDKENPGPEASPGKTSKTSNTPKHPKPSDVSSHLPATLSRRRRGGENY